MARPRRKAPPLTVSRAALLARGSDAEFRRLIHDLIAYGHKLDACRDAFAAIAGISGAQYEILMLVSRADGLSIGEVAARMHRSGAFITIEVNKLVGAGILEKCSDPNDGRRVLLRCSEKGVALLERMAPYQRRVNDVLFEPLDAKRFRALRALAAELVACGDRAVAMLELLLHEAEAA
ncbi:MAG TPA: MarR family transcriptional regulator [Burkholderiales bacterium]|jgi:DNA-binding MarR family transcriptional regulator|nr:MarR family transcriptional regulator [Burkholderiales bacterium]